MTTTAIDLGQEAVDLLPDQFDDGTGVDTRVQSLARILAAAFQSIEDDACTLLEDGLLSNATGALLDRYGVLVGVPRGGRPDEEYRALIKVRIKSNNSSGTINSILDVISVLSQDGLVEYDPLYPACYYLTVTPPPASSPLTAQQIVDIVAALFDLTPAGVSFYAVEAATPAFAFDVDPADPTATTGFDEGCFARFIGGS